jgi:hypothetical protein
MTSIHRKQAIAAAGSAASGMNPELVAIVYDADAPS